MGQEQVDNVLLLARHEGLDLPQLCPVCQLTLLEMLRDTDLSWYLPRDRDLLLSRDRWREREREQDLPGCPPGILNIIQKSSEYLSICYTVSVNYQLFNSNSCNYCTF